MFSPETSFVYALILGAIVIIALVVIIILFVYAYRQKSLAHHSEKKRLQADFEQELLKTSMEMKDETMKAIGAEIHDNICQTLGLVRLTLNTMVFDETPDPEKVQQSQELVGKALIDLRSLSKSLDHESVMQAGLVKALKYELERLQRTGVFRAEFYQSDDVADLGPQKEMMIFRMVQESLANIVKHAQASEVKLKVDSNPERVLILVEDDGVGFVEKPDESRDMDSGSGLRNMRNRAVLMGGSFQIHGKQPQGTRVEILVPVM